MRRSLRLPPLTAANLALLVACAALALPMLYNVAKFSWSTEQGGHGPLVLATGLWLLWREFRESDAPLRRPRPLLAAVGIALLLGVYFIAHVTGILEIEAFAIYSMFLLGAYLLWGGAILRQLWFPLLYLALTLPPPDTVVAAVTQPIKILISQVAVSLLHGLGYPIANSGVTIQIAQYELLVAAACAGLNSILSLSAICLFYGYLRHRSDFVQLSLIAIAIIPVAILSNFVRVLVLILITYYFGEAAAQGFLHNFAGLTMFLAAILSIFAYDEAVERARRRLRRTA
ncbi:MAG: exosortase V [Sphingomicrobium sp.]|nr:exosortase V [Sphingomonadales bacterium]